jgi:hypothetical protein
MAEPQITAISSYFASQFAQTGERRKSPGTHRKSRGRRPPPWGGMGRGASIIDVRSYPKDSGGREFPIDGVEADEATEAWRRALRYARQTGTATELAELIEQSEPADETLREHCASLRR